MSLFDNLLRAQLMSEPKRSYKPSKCNKEKERGTNPNAETDNAKTAQSASSSEGNQETSKINL